VLSTKQRHSTGGTVLVAPIVLVQTQGKNDKNVIVLIRFGSSPHNVQCSLYHVVSKSAKIMVLLTQKGEVLLTVSSTSTNRLIIAN
jgi:hypothetical protein